MTYSYPIASYTNSSLRIKKTGCHNHDGFGYSLELLTSKSNVTELNIQIIAKHLKYPRSEITNNRRNAEKP